MSDALAAAESSVVEMVGASFSGATPASTPAASEPEADVVKFEFDDAFQTRIAAFAVRDDGFMRRSAHLLKPEYFENIGEATLVNIALKHFRRYGSIPDNKIMTEVIRDEVKSGVIRKDVIAALVPARKKILTEPLEGREYVEEKLVTFVRHQAVGEAILKSVDLREKGQFDKIEKLVKSAIEIGLNEDGESYDYFARNQERAEERLDRASGKMPPTGITTGIHRMDELLYHKGWGKKELTTIMGGAKAGKTTALINFAKSASLAGHNTLYVTLEVSARIISERLDASISDTMVKLLDSNIHDVKAKIEAASLRAGRLVIDEFPSGTLKPSMLRKLLEKYRSKGVVFDLVVVDYADIMAPDFRTDNVIENSKTIYVDLRAIASEFNVAMLTATQTNREGYKATVAKAEHVAEDFNKVRTVDLMISINKTEEEASRNEARLYFAASRNQESGFTIFIKQDLAKMQFVTSILKIE